MSKLSEKIASLTIEKSFGFNSNPKFLPFGEVMSGLLVLASGAIPLAFIPASLVESSSNTHNVSTVKSPISDVLGHYNISNNTVYLNQTY
jgi:ribosomal protein S1